MGLIVRDLLSWRRKGVGGSGSGGGGCRGCHYMRLEMRRGKLRGNFGGCWSKIVVGLRRRLLE